MPGVREEPPAERKVLRSMRTIPSSRNRRRRSALTARR
ncbi:MAG: hypothetical protein MZV70_28485 [Desulfobacterales bacterium]|nr:hypothetical protein [Desulfobacterales bacterium]